MRAASKRDGIDGRILQLIGEIEIRIEAHVHGAQQLHVRAAARGLRHQQVLPVVCKLHVGARDFDAGARAGILLIAACVSKACESVTLACAVSTSASALTAAR